MVTMEITKSLDPKFKENYLRLIACGHVESSALKALEVDWLDFFELCAKDPTFRKDIEESRKLRADKWIDDIVESVQYEYTFTAPDGTTMVRPPSKDENARDKLHFEKRKFLAQVDNPEKYGALASAKKTQINIDLSEFKLLTPQEAQTALNSDPFNKMVTIDAEVIDDAKADKE